MLQRILSGTPAPIHCSTTRCEHLRLWKTSALPALTLRLWSRQAASTAARIASYSASAAAAGLGAPAAGAIAPCGAQTRSYMSKML